MIPQWVLLGTSVYLAIGVAFMEWGLRLAEQNEEMRQDREFDYMLEAMNAHKPVRIVVILAGAFIWPIFILALIMSIRVRVSITRGSGGKTEEE